MSRLIILGLDGATFDLILPWAAEGKLPAFARLLSTGSHAPLQSVIHPFTAQAWSSMVTGANAGKHRIFDFWERDFGVYGFRLTNASYRAAPALWKLISQVGRRVIVVNVPMTYPPEPVNGLLISGWDTPGLGAAYTYPESLKAELPELAGQPYVIVPDDWKWSAAGRGDAALAELLREVDVRMTVVRKLMAREPWDLCFFVVSAPDGAAHFLWKYHDASHPLHDAAEAARTFTADPMLQVYQRVDHHLAVLLDGLPPDTRVILVSDHGEGPLGDVEIHLNLWLAQQGLLHFRAQRTRRTLPALGRTMIAKAVNRGKHLLYGRVSFSTLARLRRLWPDRFRAALGEESFFPGVDWSRTTAYSEEVRGNVWVNLQGRDPQGIVPPGAEYEAVRDRVITGLSQLTDPRTGRRLVRRVWRREERFSGPFVERIPDLLVEALDCKEGEAEYPDLFRPRGGYRGADPVHHLTVPEMKRRRTTGSHRSQGIFIAQGEGIRPGFALAGAEITDVAPTALYLLGEPIPGWMDGRVLTEILEPGLLQRQPILRAGSDENLAEERLEYTDDEAKMLADRLSGLGYL